MNENEFFEILETEELEMNESFSDLAQESKEMNFKSNDILRIEENVSHSWSGVTNCGHTDRIRRECAGAVERWARNKMFEYRQYRWIRYGNESSRVHITQRNPPFGPRSCGARTSIPCYIEFRKA